MSGATSGHCVGSSVSLASNSFCSQTVSTVSATVCPQLPLPLIAQVTEAMVTRMKTDEDVVSKYFEGLLKPDKLAKHMQQLADLRILLSADTCVLI